MVIILRLVVGLFGVVGIAYFVAWFVDLVGWLFPLAYGLLIAVYPSLGVWRLALLWTNGCDCGDFLRAVVWFLYLWFACWVVLVL